MKHAWLHRCVYRIAYVVMYPILRWRYRFQPRIAHPKRRPYIVVSNHVTNLDPLLAGLSFPRPMYYVASEHLLRDNFLGRLLRFLVSPISRVKARTEMGTAMEILRRLKAGHNICLFAEGSCSWSGETGPIASGTAKLIRRSGAALITYQLHGGFFTFPRWAAHIRPGRMWGHVVREYAPEELARMSLEELEAAIKRDIYVNAYQDNEEAKIPYRGKNLAEKLEAVLYLCPSCGRLGSLHSQGDTFTCACGLALRFDEYAQFSCLARGYPPFRTVLHWDRFQRQRTREHAEEWKRLPPDTPIMEDEGQLLTQFEPGGKVTPLGRGRFTTYANRLVFQKEEPGAEPLLFPLQRITDMALMQQSILTFTMDRNRHFELRSILPRSGLKYLMVCSALSDMRIMP